MQATCIVLSFSIWLTAHPFTVHASLRYIQWFFFYLGKGKVWKQLYVDWCKVSNWYAFCLCKGRARWATGSQRASFSGSTIQKDMLVGFHFSWQLDVCCGCVLIAIVYPQARLYLKYIFFSLNSDNNFKYW